MLGLLGYDVGAAGRTVARGLCATMSSRAMQSLIHANLDGATRKEVYALDGAAGPAGPAARP